MDRPVFRALRLGHCPRCPFVFSRVPRGSFAPVAGVVGFWVFCRCPQGLPPLWVEVEDPEDPAEES